MIETIFLALFEMPSAGTVILGIVIALLASLNAVQLYQRESKQRLIEDSHRWKSAAEAGRLTFEFAEKELGAVRQRCQRLEESLDATTKDNAVLRSRTDLDALSKMLNSEGRRAQEAHEAILHGLENLAGSVGEMTRQIVEMTREATNRDAQYATLISSQSELIKSLQSQMNLRQSMPARKAS